MPNCPATYLFYENVVLNRFLYHTPVQVGELLIGLMTVVLIAFLLIGSQTPKAARRNPMNLLDCQ